MTVYELVERLGGEIVRGRARWYDGAEHILIGKLNGNDMEFTDAGRRLTESLIDGKTPTKRKRKAEVLDTVDAIDGFNADIELLSPTVD